MAIQGFAEVLASYPRPGDPLGYSGSWRENAVLERLVPVSSDWVVCYALTSDGAPVSSDGNDWGHAVTVTDPRQRNAILAQAAIRFPELAHLRPHRRATDVDCPTCNGKGGFPKYPALICECGNLGWVPGASQRTESP